MTAERHPSVQFVAESFMHRGRISNETSKYSKHAYTVHSTLNSGDY